MDGGMDKTNRVSKETKSVITEWKECIQNDEEQENIVYIFALWLSIYSKFFDFSTSQ